MKKTILSLTITTSCLVFASNFNVIIGSEDVNYEVGGFTDRIEDNGWTNKGLEDCSFDIIESDLYYNKKENQTETCNQEQEKTITKIRTYESGKEEVVYEKKEYQTLKTTSVSEITGTHLEPSCKAALSFDSTLSTGVQQLSHNTGNYEAYCDMDKDGGGWTMLVLNREQVGHSVRDGSVQNITTLPNYDSWTTEPHNGRIVDLNSTVNVFSSAIDKVPFKEIYFECHGAACEGEANTYSIYTDTKESLFNEKSGSMARQSSTDFPFSKYDMYYVPGNHSNPKVSTDNIFFYPQCAASSFRGYSACVRIGLVGLDYYSFQNAVGIGLKAHETYAEHIYGNVTFGFMAHRVLDTIEANIFIR